MDALPAPAPSPGLVREERPLLRLEGIVKTFGGVSAVAGVDLAVERGEFFSLLGASGSGKTTLLRTIGGFEAPDAGRVLIDGVDVTGLPPYARPVNMMFQSYALFPHLTVADNVAFGLKREGMARPLIRERVAEMLDLVKLGPLAGRKPHQLSGGESQRVALARALAKHPKLLLLDEPLAALDRRLREQTRFELMAIQERVGITFVMVTHDQEEAMTMSSRIALMDRGRIAQVGAPAEVYENPRNRFVAEFLGAANLLAGVLAGRAGGLAAVALASGKLTLAVADSGAAALGAPVTLAVRPEKLRLLAAGEAAAGGNRLAGSVVEIGYQGDVSLYKVRLADGQTLLVQATNDARSGHARRRGEAVTVGFAPEAAVLLAG